MKIFLIHVRYTFAFVLAMLGTAIVCFGELINRLAKWLGSKGDKQLISTL